MARARAHGCARCLVRPGPRPDAAEPAVHGDAGGSGPESGGRGRQAHQGAAQGPRQGARGAEGGRAAGAAEGGEEGAQGGTGARSRGLGRRAAEATHLTASDQEGCAHEFAAAQAEAIGRVGRRGG